jgi:1-acyl-sn-glycerol-3-phosphate acyltransferase
MPFYSVPFKFAPSMGYYFVKILMWFYKRTYFRKVRITGLENIPVNQPVFFASNHPNGFLDGSILSSLINPPTYILVRGDVFRPSWSNAVLRTLKLIPIFRVIDGNARESVSENNKSYDQLYEMFQRNKRVMIFPQADSYPERKVKTLKKGMARIVFDMLNRPNSQRVAVVPMGINYSSFSRLQGDLDICFGQPLYLDSYLEKEASPAIAMNKLTLDTHQAIQQNMILGEREDDELLILLMAIYREVNEHQYPLFTNSKSTGFAHKRNCTERLRNGSDEDRSLLVEVLDILKYNDLSAKALRKLTVVDGLFMMIFALPAWLSWKYFSLAHFVGIWIVRTQVRKIELQDSIAFGVGMMATWLLHLMGLLLFGFYFGWMGVAAFFGFRVCALAHHRVKDIWKTLWAKRKWNKHVEGSKDGLILQTKMDQILDRFEVVNSNL